MGIYPRRTGVSFKQKPVFDFELIYYVPSSGFNPEAPIYARKIQK